LRILVVVVWFWREEEKREGGANGFSFAEVVRIEFWLGLHVL
jgi:hypothetical protein